MIAPAVRHFRATDVQCTERPIFFTVVTLLISALVLRYRPRWTASDRRGQPLEVLRPPAKSPYKVPGKQTVGLIARGIDVVRRLNPPFRALLICLVARSILFWYTLRYAQCTWRGLEVRWTWPP